MGRLKGMYMNTTELLLTLAIVLVVIFILWMLFSKVVKNKKISEVSFKDFDFNIEGFIESLGGIENIKECSSTGSKVSVIVESQDIVDVTKIKEIGASGIVQTNNKVVVILGKVSKVIEEYLNSKISR